MTSNQEYILITGAAGFIGMHITSKFLKEGHNVVGVDNENDYYDVNLKKARVLQLFSIKNTSFEYIKGDINDIETWQKISQYNINMVIHLAAQAGVRYSLKNPQAYIDSNILGFQKVLDFLNK
ncbi:MAG: GDP-mannose 4,6-dehydratase [Flavobacteriaceae bacterium]